MQSKPHQKIKVLKKKPNNDINSVEDLICIPRPLYLEMVTALKGQASNGGRAKNLLAELPEVEKIK